MSEMTEVRWKKSHGVLRNWVEAAMQVIWFYRVEIMLVYIAVSVTVTLVWWIR